MSDEVSEGPDSSLAEQFTKGETPGRTVPKATHIHEHVDDQSGGDPPVRDAEWLGEGRIKPRPLEKKPEEVTPTESEEDVLSAAERAARMKKGERVGRYTLVKVIAGGKSLDKWVAVDPDGVHVFLKMFDEMIYPERTDPRFDRLSRKFDEWESHHRSVFDALRLLGVGDGALVLPLDHGRTDSGRQLYRVYPLVSRVSLGSRTASGGIPPLAEDLDRRRSELTDTEGRLRIVRSLLLALWQLHRRGIVHGDIKPDNVLVPTTPTGHVARLVDFDNCYFSGSPLAASLLGGTDKFFSPERSKYQEGDLDDPSELTVKSDVYSLAKTLQAVFGEATSSSAGRFRPGGKEFVLRLGLPTLDAALAAALETDARNRPDTHQLLCAAGVFLKR